MIRYLQKQSRPSNETKATWIRCLTSLRDQNHVKAISLFKILKELLRWPNILRAKIYAKWYAVPYVPRIQLGHTYLDVFKAGLSS